MIMIINTLKSSLENSFSSNAPTSQEILCVPALHACDTWDPSYAGAAAILMGSRQVSLRNWIQVWAVKGYIWPCSLWPAMYRRDAEEASGC